MFYRSLRNTPNASRSQDKEYLKHAVLLSVTISLKTFLSGYERFRPSNCDCHLWRRCYRGGWHPSYPPLIRQAIYTWQKPKQKLEHWEFPYRTCVHCKVFAPAAPRRARVSVSVPFSGLPLSRPLSIFGLVGHYPANDLIDR